MEAAANNSEALESAAAGSKRKTPSETGPAPSSPKRQKVGAQEGPEAVAESDTSVVSESAAPNAATSEAEQCNTSADSANDNSSCQYPMPSSFPGQPLVPHFVAPPGDPALRPPCSRADPILFRPVPS